MRPPKFVLDQTFHQKNFLLMRTFHYMSSARLTRGNILQRSGVSQTTRQSASTRSTTRKNSLFIPCSSLTWAVYLGQLPLERRGGGFLKDYLPTSLFSNLANTSQTKYSLQMLNLIFYKFLHNILTYGNYHSSLSGMCARQLSGNCSNSDNFGLTNSTKNDRC